MLKRPAALADACWTPPVQAVIAADRGEPYGDVGELIDLVKNNGGTTFALDVERAPEAPPPTP